MSTYNYTIPDVMKLEESDYKYYGNSWYRLTTDNIDALCNDRPFIFDRHCKKCNVTVQITVRLCDNTPCYTAVCVNNKHTVKHCYIAYIRGNSYQLLSLITNNLSTVKAELLELRQRFSGNNIYIGKFCLTVFCKG